MASYPIKIVEEDGVEYILDSIRKKYVRYTPEEYVRQECIRFLIEDCNFPKGCISVEKKIQIGDRFLRYDIVVYKDVHPWMLIECKAPTITINTEIFMQSLVYQHTLQAKYIMLTNGEQTICLDVANRNWMEEMITWDDEIQ